MAHYAPIWHQNPLCTILIPMGNKNTSLPPSGTSSPWSVVAWSVPIKYRQKDLPRNFPSTATAPNSEVVKKFKLYWLFFILFLTLDSYIINLVCHNIWFWLSEHVRKLLHFNFWPLVFRNSSSNASLKSLSSKLKDLIILILSWFLEPRDVFW